MNPLLIALIQLLLVLGLAPLAIGLTRFFKARLQGRQGAAPWLPYISFATMLKKENVVLSQASWMFTVTPYMVLGSAIFLALVLPLVSLGQFTSELGNLFVVASVLVLGAAFLVMGGLESASAFGGMGASREMTITALLEPTIILTLATLFVITGSSNVGEMMGFFAVNNPWFPFVAVPTLLLPLGALFLIALAENARYPVDNPATHLELTMVHEAMVLNYSGPYLAMLEYASALKLTIFGLLIANFIFPFPLLNVALNFGGAMIDILAVSLVTLLKLALIMLLVALFESTIVKMRFYRVQEYLTASFFIALAGLSLAIISHIV